MFDRIIIFNCSQTKFAAIIVPLAGRLRAIRPTLISYVSIIDPTVNYITI